MSERVNEYIEAESDIVNRLQAAEREVRTLTMMITSEDNKNLFNQLRKEYDKEFARLNNLIVRRYLEEIIWNIEILIRI